MKTLGRNDPCPCGSGKKYKKCCLINIEQHDFEYRRQRRVESDLIPLLFEFAGTMLKETAVQDAWIEFNGDDEVEPFSTDDPMNMVFMPWFFFSWTFELGSYLRNETPEIKDDDDEKLHATIAELFFATLHDSLTEDQRAFLQSAGLATYTLCEVLEVRPSSGMKLRDLLREREFDVIEHSASQSLKRGEIIYCAPITIGGIVSNLSTSPYALKPTCKMDVLNFRKQILAELDKQSLNDDDLFACEPDFRFLYLELLAPMFAPPQLANTDGDRLIPQRVYFDLDSTDAAFRKLKGLASESYQDELLKSVKKKGRQVVEAEIPWLQEGLVGPVLLGMLRIKNYQLVAEVNSNARVEQIQEIVEERLGDHARYKMTSISPFEGEVEKLWEQAMNSPAAKRRMNVAATDDHDPHPKNLNITGASNETSHSKSPDDFDPFSSLPEDFDPDSAEVQTLLKEFADQHWSTWYDLPVPALDNMTPREATLTPEGRDLLESLLLYYEIENDRNPSNNAAPDIASLRRELGME